MYRYETHMHTLPVSRCAKASVEESVAFYKEKGYDGIFITNHFLDGDIFIETPHAAVKRLKYYFSDYDEAKKIGDKIGIKVFLGIETTTGGTDFLIYGLDKEWYFEHPEISGMKMSKKLSLLRESGAFIVQAHPFREAGYIDHIRLYPRHIDGVEVINACRSDFENGMAELFAEKYGLYRLAGSDNHVASGQPTLAGIESQTPFFSEKDFINAVKSGKTNIFTLDNK